MDDRAIYITEYDLQRLNRYVQDTYSTNPALKPYLDSLLVELGRSQIVAPRDVPPDVITMNSRVCLLDREANEEMEYTLVFPEDADLAQNKISVLAPIGTAILGYRVGSVIQWQVPDGIRRLEVLRLPYQPEAAGDYHL